MARFQKWINDASPGRTTAEVAASTLKQRLRAVEKYLHSAAIHPRKNIEDVHQLRIWTRRASAAVALYDDLLPPRAVARIARMLKRIRKAANEARDTDVLLERLRQDDSLPRDGKLLRRLSKRRKRAQRPIEKIERRLISSHRLRRRAKKLRRALSSSRGDVRFGLWAPQRMRPIVDEFLQAACQDHTGFKQLHAFRLQTKKLRYAMELTTAAFPADFQQRLYPRIEALQERLGTINDRATAQDLFKAWLEDAEPRDARYIECLLEKETDELVQAHTQFLEWWTPEQVRELSAEFDRLYESRGLESPDVRCSNRPGQNGLHGKPNRKETIVENALGKDKTSR